MTFSKIRQYIKGVLSNLFNKTLSNIAPKFDPTETYSIGNRVIYNGDLYRFTSAHTGAWTSTDASKTNINALLNNNTFACGGGYAPIGTVIAYMGTRAPSDFLICDGTVYNIADYTELADYFESQFGESNHFGGNGTTTFAVPDLQGEFLRGTGTNSHANQGSGANVGVHQDGTEHIGLGKMNDGRLLSAWNNTINGLINPDSEPQLSSKVGSSVINIGNGSNNISPTFTSRPTNTSVLYCIKAKSQGNGYSLDEQIVGTWIDGKPIYQKTLSLNGSNVNLNDDNDVGLGSIGIDEIIFANGMFRNLTNRRFPFPYVNQAGLTYLAGFFFTDTFLLGLRFGNNIRSISKIYITIRYTKTND